MGPLQAKTAAVSLTWMRALFVAFAIAPSPFGSIFASYLI